MGHDSQDMLLKILFRSHEMLAPLFQDLLRFSAVLFYQRFPLADRLTVHSVVNAMDQMNSPLFFVKNERTFIGSDSNIGGAPTKHPIKAFRDTSYVLLNSVQKRGIEIPYLVIKFFNIMPNGKLDRSIKLVDPISPFIHRGNNLRLCAKMGRFSQLTRIKTCIKPLPIAIG